MALSHIPSNRVILMLGAPRSGTSWLAKIFDSHPDVRWRKELSLHDQHRILAVVRQTSLASYCPAIDA